MNAGGRRYSVVVDKRPRVRVIFSTGLDSAAAELLAAQLAKIGCPARVVRAAAGDVAGMQRRRKTSAKATTCPAGS